MLTLLFLSWLLYATFKLGIFAIRAGWGILSILLSVVFLPVIIVVLLVVGIIKLTVPILLVLGLVTLCKAFAGKRV